MTKILVPVNGDEADEGALEVACNLVKRDKGKIYILHVVEVKRSLPLDAEMGAEAARGERLLRWAERLVWEQGCQAEAELLQARQAGPAVVNEAVERGVEAIVVGLSYKVRFGQFDMGSTVPYLLKNSPCQVIVFRERPKTMPGAEERP